MSEAFASAPPAGGPAGIAKDISCAVMRSGDQIALSLDRDPGRGAVALLEVEPAISWRCADGTVERLGLRGPDAGQDREDLARAIQAEGLLVLEYAALRHSAQDPDAMWLLGPQGTIAEDASAEAGGPGQ